MPRGMCVRHARCDDQQMTITEQYAHFAAREAREVSPGYERLAWAVSRDQEILALLAGLPTAKRQPNLLFGVVRLLGGPVDNPAAFHDYTLANWSIIDVEMRTRVTQTNEAGRCAVLLPVLAALPQPLALLEVGASAGLCLYPDRYAYRYGDHVLGSGQPVLQCAPTGTAPPVGVPDVVWRAGVDLNPLDVTDPSDVAWLDALIWPEHAHRRARLRAAAAVAAADPPLLVRGDLVNDLPALAARAPVGATLVVFHTSVLYQVPAPKRAAFADVVRGLPGHRIANEAPRRAAVRRATSTANRRAVQRARAGRHAACLDWPTRTGHHLVRLTAQLCVGQRTQFGMVVLKAPETIAASEGVAKDAVAQPDDEQSGFAGDAGANREQGEIDGIHNRFGAGPGRPHGRGHRGERWSGPADSDGAGR
jgi:hypothetical protein